MKLSVAMITYNEEAILAKTLQSVKSIADEIIIVDNGSTDRTPAIAKSFNACFYTEPWKGYGLQKNSAIEKCTGDMILNIDADEVVSEELAKEIEYLKKSSNIGDVYKIRLCGVCFEKMLKYGGWNVGDKIRLFKKGAGQYDDSHVHESFITEADIHRLHGCIYHHTYTNLRDMIAKDNRYTTEAALELYRRGKKPSFMKLLLNPFYKFLLNYIFKLGFLDGQEGFVLALSDAYYAMSKYFKLYEIYKNGSYIEKYKQ